MQNKLVILSDAAKYDASCAASGEAARLPVRARSGHPAAGSTTPISRTGAASAGASQARDELLADPIRAASSSIMEPLPVSAVSRP